MSAARAAVYLLDEGPHRTAQAIELIRGIVADDTSTTAEIVEASLLLRRVGLTDEALAAACIAAARGAELPQDIMVEKRRWYRRHLGFFSRAA